MSGSIKTILRDLGLVIHVPGVMALASLPVCFLFDERYAVAPFLWTAFVSLALGQLLYHACRHSEETQLHHGLLIAAWGWLVVPFLGALPFLLVAWGAYQGAAPTLLAFAHPLNALFESFSGFTGTGLTMAVHPSQLPRSLQWWRSLMEWVGGVGVIVLVLSVLKATSGAFRLYFSEGREEKIFPTVKSTLHTMWWIYLVLTAFGVLLLRAVGMGWWAALNHGMTAVATGGFGLTDHSIGDYGVAVRLALIPLMLAGAISFAVHHELLVKRRLSALWRDPQHRLLWWLVGGGFVALALENVWSGQWVWVDTLFQWTSALSTAGFQTVDLATWSPTAQLLLSLAMVAGGAAGSTAGGIKLVRLVVLHKGVVWRFQRLRLGPHQLMRYALGDEALSQSEAGRLVEGAGVLAALWGVVLWAAVLILLHVVPDDVSLSQVIFEVASAQGNVGLSAGITGPELHWLGKLTLMFSMWVGRLEIVPVLILLSSWWQPWSKWRARREST